MNFHIAICDDDIDIRYMLREEVTKFNMEAKKDGEIQLFQNGNEFLEAFFEKNIKFDVLLLDVDMPELSGFEVAELVNAKKRGMKIIFVSSHNELVFDAFEFEPFRYIRKERVRVELPRVLERVYEMLEARDDRYIIINDGERERKVKHEDICYFEIRNRRIELHLIDAQIIRLRKTFTAFLNEIHSVNFVKISTGCCVNIKYIEEISKHHIMLENGEQLMGSVPMIKEAKVQIEKYWRIHE